jgi:hypothetical protein
MGQFGADSLFALISVIHITFFFFVLYWIRRRLPIAPEARDSFTVFPRTTYAAVQIEERADTTEQDENAKAEIP